MNDIESLELKISKFLRWGVAISGIMMFIGWISRFKWTGNPFFNFETYDPIPLLDLLHFHTYRGNWGVLIAYAGLVTLISLPILRVLFTLVLFYKRKEYALAMIAGLVFLGLIVSFTFGIEL